MDSLRSKRLSGFGILGIVGLLIVTFGILFFNYLRSTSHAALTSREIATRVLAEHLSKVLKPDKVLVISNPFSQMAGKPPEVYQFENAGIKGLRDGFGSGVQLRIVFPRLKPEIITNPEAAAIDPRTKTPLSFLMTENAFSELLSSNRDCALVVSLIGLPLNLQTLPEWTKPGSPQFALLMPDWRMIGDSESINASFQSGKLAAVVMRKPGAPRDDQQPAKEMHVEFESRYLLVTKTNVKQALEAFGEEFR